MDFNVANQTIGKVTEELFENFEFGENPGRPTLYRFIWDDFCDWYIKYRKALTGDIEAAKLTTRSILVYVLDNTLRLLPNHAFRDRRNRQSVPTLREIISGAFCQRFTQNKWTKNGRRMNS